MSDNLTNTLEKFKEKNEVLNAFIRAFFSQSPGELRNEAFKILKVLNEDFSSPLTQKELLHNISSSKDSNVSVSSLRRRLKSLTETGLVTELVAAGIDARNTYYKLSPEIHSILARFISVLDLLEDKTHINVAEFLSREIEDRVNVPTDVYTKKIRHGYILIGVNLTKPINSSFCKKELCGFCNKVVRKVINSLFPLYEFNVISEKKLEDKCKFRYTIRPN
ncbi:MAG: hypothetical protein HWN67_12090 [Candidatus Helarchaeota archaeon]|nr:hypothetical protein [Candidatus Helarchaeota archaeon]